MKTIILRCFNKKEQTYKMVICMFVLFYFLFLKNTYATEVAAKAAIIISALFFPHFFFSGVGSGVTCSCKYSSASDSTLTVLPSASKYNNLDQKQVHLQLISSLLQYLLLFYTRQYFDILQF